MDLHEQLLPKNLFLQLNTQNVSLNVDGPVYSFSTVAWEQMTDNDKYNAQRTKNYLTDNVPKYILNTVTMKRHLKSGKLTFYRDQLDNFIKVS